MRQVCVFAENYGAGAAGCFSCIRSASRFYILLTAERSVFPTLAVGEFSPFTMLVFLTMKGE